MLWEIDIYPKASQVDALANETVTESQALGLGTDSMKVRSCHGYLLQGALDREQAEKIARELLADCVVEEPVVFPVSEAKDAENGETLVNVLPKPGVMDPVANSALKAIKDMDLPVEVSARSASSSFPVSIRKTSINSAGRSSPTTPSNRSSKVRSRSSIWKSAVRTISS